MKLKKLKLKINIIAKIVKKKLKSKVTKKKWSKVTKIKNYK
jgi:hypothetical protein